MNSFDENASVYHVLLKQIVKDIITEVAVSLKNDFITEVKKVILEFKIQNDEHHLTISEVCKILRISKPTLNKYTKENRLTALRIGQKILYSREEVNQKLHLLNQSKRPFKTLDL